LSGQFTLSQSHDIIITIDDVVAEPGQQNVPIPIYLNNYGDTLAAFMLWLQLDRPDICEFRYECDTIDPYQVCYVEIDTAGTLISGWETAFAVTPSRFGFDAKIVAFCLTSPGIGQYSGSTPLIKVIADAYYIPDTLADRTAAIHLNPDLMHVQFSDPDGNSLGVIKDTIVDTTCYNCINWHEDVCLEWELAPGTTGDSCAYDTTVGYILDTAGAVKLTDGSLTILDVSPCGDFTADGFVNILDIVALIRFIYGSRIDYRIRSYEEGDMNGDGSVNLLDIVYLINFVYNEGPSPICD
jgi:hypothetical protein